MSTLSDIAKELLAATVYPRDKLPYTEEFDRLYEACRSKGVHCNQFEFMQQIFAVAKRGGFAGRTSTVSAPWITLTQTVYIGRWLGDRLASRDSLPYSQEFEIKYIEYVKRFESSISRFEFWLVIDQIAKRSRGKDWRSQLNKSQESALLAVEIYNKPLVKFKTATYVVLMVIAWTALMHAIFAKLGVEYTYKGEDGEEYITIGGEKKAWQLATCVENFFGSSDDGIIKNIKFFIGLRNKIEHRSMPELDEFVFGECQALLFNFEDILREIFGNSASLVGNLALAIQFSQLREDSQLRSIRELRRSLQADIVEYVDRFRSTLSSDVIGSQQYSYRVLLLPRAANRDSASDLAVEFVRVDPASPEDQPKRDMIAALIKPAIVQVANAGKLKASQVCKAVEAEIRKSLGAGTTFTASSHHVRAWKFYRIRPDRGDTDPRSTKLEFCHYDDAHQDYVYTEKWVKFLIQEFRKTGQFDRVMAFKGHKAD